LLGRVRAIELGGDDEIPCVVEEIGHAQRDMPSAECFIQPADSLVHDEARPGRASEVADVHSERDHLLHRPADSDDQGREL
jgi:hypothetical protein